MPARRRLSLFLLALAAVAAVLLLWVQKRRGAAGSADDRAVASRSSDRGLGPDGLRRLPAPAFPFKADPPPPDPKSGLNPKVLTEAIGRFQFENMRRVDQCLFEAGIRGPREVRAQLISFKRRPGAAANPAETEFAVTRVIALPTPGDRTAAPQVPAEQGGPPPGMGQRQPGSGKECVQRLVSAGLRVPSAAAGETTEFSTVVPLYLPVADQSDRPRQAPGGPSPTEGGKQASTTPIRPAGRP